MPHHQAASLLRLHTTAAPRSHRTVRASSAARATTTLPRARPATLPQRLDLTRLRHQPLPPSTTGWVVARATTPSHQSLASHAARVFHENHHLLLHTATVYAGAKATTTRLLATARQHPRTTAPALRPAHSTMLDSVDARATMDLHACRLTSTSSTVVGITAARDTMPSFPRPTQSF